MCTPLKISVDKGLQFRGGSDYLKPFWDSRCEDLSNKIWLPTYANCVKTDNGETSPSSSAQHKELFWRSLVTEVHTPSSPQATTCSLSFPPCLPTCKPEENKLAAEAQFHTSKIRIYPSPKMKVWFNKCLGASRFFYNQTNALLKKWGRFGWKTRRGHYRDINFYDIRSRIVATGLALDFIEKKYSWQKEIPACVKNEAVKECFTSYKGCWTKMRKGTLDHYDVKFKSRKAPRQTFTVEKSMLKSSRLFVNRFKDTPDQAILRTRKRDRELLNRGSDGDFTIFKHAHRWYVCLLKRVKEKKEKKNAKGKGKGKGKKVVKKKDVQKVSEGTVQSEKAIIDQSTYQSVFLDSGVTPFQAFYSPDGICGSTGEEYNLLVNKYHEKVDNLQSFLDNPTWTLHKKTQKKVNRTRLRRKIARLRGKVSDVVNDLHWKFGNFLVRNFETILIPVFETQKMVKKDRPGGGERQIRNSTSRMLMTFKHYRFRQRLHHLAHKYNRQLVVVEEPYTSKTCGNCGAIKEDLEGKKIYRCSDCKTVIDRDYNGARNNGLAYLTIHKASF